MQIRCAYLACSFTCDIFFLEDASAYPHITRKECLTITGFLLQVEYNKLFLYAVALYTKNALSLMFCPDQGGFI
jgi:hypothetical protein